MSDDNKRAMLREQALVNSSGWAREWFELDDALTTARRERDEAQRYAATQLEVAAAEVALRIERERERDEALAIVDMLHDMLDTAFVPRLGTDIGGDLPEDKKPWTLSERLAFLVGYVSTARKRGEPRDGRASSALERAEQRGDGKLVGASTIEAAARKLLEALPRCRYDGLDVSEPCQARAMWVCFDLTCAPEFRCDVHKYEHAEIGGCFDHAESHPTWWADAAAKLAAELEEET